ncbi:MAG TPA: sigma-70 family RNA polymerase sigma factor [Verrucomicrobiae bacterium]
MDPDNQTTPDEDLARQGRAGSLAAFEKLVRRYERRIYSFAARCCGSAEDAAEITQDTFVKAYQALNQFDAGRNFGTWLFTIARRKCIDRRRTAGPAPAEMPELMEPDNPAEKLVREEDAAAIWSRAARLLPPNQFQALWLRYVEDMTVAEVARVLRKTRTHVKVLLFRARRTLARHLSSEAPQTASAADFRPLGLGIPRREQPL